MPDLDAALFAPGAGECFKHRHEETVYRGLPEVLGGLVHMGGDGWGQRPAQAGERGDHVWGLLGGHLGHHADGGEERNDFVNGEAHGGEIIVAADEEPPVLAVYGDAIGAELGEVTVDGAAVYGARFRQFDHAEAVWVVKQGVFDLGQPFVAAEGVFCHGSSSFLPTATHAV